jgi:hypothetical protein
MHLVILFRSYSSKKAYFSMDKSKNPVVMKKASDFLDNAARLRQTEMCVIIDGFEAKKKSGAIPSSIPDGKIYAAAEQQATFAQANHIARANLNPRQMQEFERSFSDAQHPNGSTWTAGYGNLSLNSEQISSRAAEQRSRNTGLAGTAAARASAGAVVLAPCNREKRPILDIFSQNDEGNICSVISSKKKKSSGLDRIWDRMYGANARDLNLHKPRAELSAAEKTARKTAKKTTAKMEATVAAGLSNNRVKEILACQRVPLSQGTDYLEGKVTDERGNNFCSQDALLMLRNQLDDNSSKDK